MAITDADDNFVASAAHPSFADYGLPVAGICTVTVPNEDASWSDVKELHR